MIALSTYLLLDGTCKEAMEFYQSCLGGELSISLVGDTPMKQMFPPEMHDRVINAHLKSEGIALSASDWMLANQRPVVAADAAPQPKSPQGLLRTPPGPSRARRRLWRGKCLDASPSGRQSA